MNKFVLSGRLTDNFKTNATESGLKVIHCCIANNDRKETRFINFTMFGDEAVRLETRCPKGSWIELEGYIEPSTYEKDGKKRTVLNLIGTHVRIIVRSKKDTSPFQDFNEQEDTNESEESEDKD